MKTLVIHPSDPTTSFLCKIYEEKLWSPDWNLIRGQVSKSELKRQIKAHDRIIMLGHGTDDGLLKSPSKGGFGFVVDSTLVYLLREKTCVCIWCNADVFFLKYKLKGFCTGMIISDYDEALMYSIYPFKGSDIEQSNTLFAECIKESIDSPTMIYEVRKNYCSEVNPIIKFNSDNIFATNGYLKQTS